MSHSYHPGHSLAEEVFAMRAASVLVIGDVILDRAIVGTVHRISPESPVPVLDQTAIRTSLGGAANVAANVAVLGADAQLIGRVGDDDEAGEVVRLLEELGVAHHLRHDHAAPTVVKTRVIADAQQIVRVDRETVLAGDHGLADWTLEFVDAFLQAGGRRAIVLADYAKGFLGRDLIQAINARATRAGVPVVSDPKGTDLSTYAGSTVVKPNLYEARRAVGGEISESPNTFTELSELVVACQRASRARNVVLSCAADGVIVFGDEVPDATHLGTAAREVADVTGAGDTLVAMVALGLAAALPLMRAVEIANVCAGAVCGKAGTATLSATEVILLLSAGDPVLTASNPKILHSYAEAASLGAQFIDESRTLVFANGCFDLLHAGHIHLLQSARSHGDALMVALNRDESVRRLKGPTRPLQEEQDRCEIIAALSCVDFVVLFDEETPLELIKVVRPRVLVKGDDYDENEVVGGTEVVSWGGPRRDRAARRGLVHDGPDRQGRLTEE